ncbi:hypothetical protein [Umezawaea sp. Da 62-37]|uniref:hypothetical protein n=1 Tax=Umezawaea sp. Da 62-37 TaxID=3075927 RepID=UPI0028F7432C|nr:hypothetical protein [Umezawaea sp. Da 62-37]WNV87646.1 hypothetical protein RM788_04920 [Umezawaea sp. Da 62-37]
MNRLKRRLASAIAVSGIVATAVLGGAATASATDPADAPPGYAGPYATCNGAPLPPLQLSGTPGYVQLWLDRSGSGTFCAKTFDNLGGDHHTEIILQRVDWQTRWYDSGTYSTYAGGIYVSGANAHCSRIYGEVTVNGVAHRLPSVDGWATVCAN